MHFQLNNCIEISFTVFKYIQAKLIKMRISLTANSNTNHAKHTKECIVGNGIMDNYVKFQCTLLWKSQWQTVIVIMFNAVNLFICNRILKI